MTGVVITISLGPRPSRDSRKEGLVSNVCFFCAESGCSAIIFIACSEPDIKTVGSPLIPLSDLEKHEEYDFVTVRVKVMKTNDPQH